jgi:hypothetical protein
MTKIEERGTSRKRNQTFTGAKMDWLTATARHAPPSYFKIGFFLAQHINETTGKGFPTQEWLAELTCLSLPTVERAVRFFREGGWLTVEQKHVYDYKAKKWKTRNTYSMDFKCVQDALDGITVLRLERRKRREQSDQSITGERSLTGEGQTLSKKERRKEVGVP